jgi:hypothetical protein
MGLLRVTAIALAACSAAGADPVGAPSRERAHPESWKQLPSIAMAVGAAARAEGVAIDAVDAWGERANGCYAVWLALRGTSGDAPVLADQVLAGLARARVARSAGSGAGSAGSGAGSGAGSSSTGELQITELAKPVGREGVLSFAFASAPYRGRLRAQLGGGRIDAVACFGNQRAPLACDVACVQVLEGTP